MNHPFGGNIARVDTSQKYPLGFKVCIPARQASAGSSAEGPAVDQGDQVWTYVKNAEGATAFAIGNPVVMDTDTTPYHCSISGTGNQKAIRVAGVAQHAIAAGSFGFVLSNGSGLVKAEAGGVSTAGTYIQAKTTAGCAAAIGGDSVDQIIGWITATIAAGATGNALLRCGI